MCYTLQQLNKVYFLKSKFWEKYTFPEWARERFLFGAQVRICGLYAKSKGRTESVPSFGGVVRNGELKFYGVVSLC